MKAADAIGHPVTRLRRVQFGGSSWAHCRRDVAAAIGRGTARRVSALSLRLVPETRATRSGLAEKARADSEISSSVTTSAAASTTGPAAIPGSAFIARSTAGMATPSRHAKIIDSMIARKIEPATASCPRQAKATIPTTAAQPVPSSVAVLNSFHSAVNNRFHTIGPSVSPERERERLHADAFAKREHDWNEQRQHHHLLQQKLEAAGDQRGEQPAGDVQSSHGNRSRNANHGDCCAVPCTPISGDVVVGALRQGDHLIREQADGRRHRATVRRN